jgi:NitT/TauT family transport system permease protein
MNDALDTQTYRPTKKMNASMPKKIAWRTILWRLRPLFTMLVLLLAWQSLVWLQIYPEFIIPPPSAVWQTFTEVLVDGTLLNHIAVTLNEIFWGMLLGVSVGTFLGYVLARSRWLGDILSPVIVGFQATPIVAYAPLLIIWFGSGATSKIITCAIIVFFPTLMNTWAGLRQIPQNLQDVMRVMRASRWQMFIKLELPASLPVLLTGLKTSATLAVIGAVVGEFVSANAGLGFLVTIARNQYDTALVFVAVFTMTAIALMLYGLVSFLEWRFLAWQRQSRRT